MRHANYRIVRESDAELVIKDVGPWSKHPTITNDAECVVQQLVWYLRGRRLLYFDSDNTLYELKVERGKFAGFASYNA
jgi:hypothetical protein